MKSELMTMSIRVSVGFMGTGWGSYAFALRAGNTKFLQLLVAHNATKADRMDKLEALKAFREVANLGGFSKAALRLRVATSSVTRLIDSLEESLGAPLLTRSTRKVTLTDTGAAYLEQVSRLLAELAEADESVADTGTEPVGPLRVCMPVTYGRLFFGPRLASFLETHPRVTLDLILSDLSVDLTAERIDLAVRVGESWKEPNLKIRKLGEQHLFVVASHEYLARRGVPASPGKLSDHECMRYSNQLGQRWKFVRGDEVERVEVSGRLTVNSSGVVREAALGGHGIALLPEWLVAEDIRSGRMRRLFEEHQVNPGDETAGVYAAYLPNREHSRKVQALLAFLEREIVSGPAS
jgi:DNA-binding transcriptional LysR family regulator